MIEKWLLSKNATLTHRQRTLHVTIAKKPDLLSCLMHVGVHDGPSVARSGPPPMLICCRSVLYAGLFAATSDLRRLIYNGVCTLHHRSTHCTRGIEGQHPTVTGAAGTTVGDEHRATTRHRDWARHTQHCLNRRAGDCRGGRGRDANLRDTPKQKQDVHLEGEHGRTRLNTKSECT